MSRVKIFFEAFKIEVLRNTHNLFGTTLSHFQTFFALLLLSSLKNVTDVGPDQHEMHKEQIMLRFSLLLENLQIVVYGLIGFVHIVQLHVSSC